MTYQNNSSFMLTRFYRKKSKNGNTYFSGKLGYSNVVLLKSNEVSDDGAEIWNLLISEGQNKGASKPKSQTATKSRSDEMKERREAIEHYQKPFDDDLPF